MEKVFTAYPVRERIRITELYSFFQDHFERGFCFPGETHNFWECLYVLDGELCVSADERVYDMRAGELIFHKPVEFHKFTVTGENGADLLIFSFSAQGPLTEGLRNKVYSLTEENKRLIGTLLSYAEKKKPTGVQMCRDELQYLRAMQTDPDYAQMVVSYLYRLLLCLAEEGRVSSASSEPNAVTFRRAISYLNCNLHRQPTVEEISRYCSISQTSLKRLFEKYAGISVHKYLIKLKLKIAVELLRENQRVADVAEKLGFTSQSYFSKAFKKEIGVNPSEIARRRAE